MRGPLAFLCGALCMAAALLAQPLVTAQAPTGSSSVVFSVVCYRDGSCLWYGPDVPTRTPTPTPTEPGVTFVPPPTFTPGMLPTIQATATDEPTPTQETTPPGTPAPTWWYSTPTATPVPDAPCMGRVTAVSGLNVREMPWGTIIGQVAFGTDLELFGYVEDNGRWFDVRWIGQWGYVHGDYIETTPECGG